MSKQKQGGGQSKQSAPESGAKGGAQEARNVKDAGAKQKRKH